jgi:hypothetical protein
MKECWDKEYWCYGGSYPSTAGTSPKLVNEVRIYSQEDPGSAVAAPAETKTSAAGVSPAQGTTEQSLAPGGIAAPLALLSVVLWSLRYKKQE